MEKIMKCYKKILIIWTSAIVVVAMSVGVVLYDNICQGRLVAKEVAIQTLRKVAERVVNREFDELGMYYAFWPDSGKKHTKRTAVSEEGEFEVVIDSLKEAQGLYPLETVGYKAYMLNCYGKFPLEEIGLEWKGEMDEQYHGTCALYLKVNPMGRDILQTSSIGDETICASKNDLGSYYLDDMYTMRLTAFMLSDFWCCVDWTNHMLQVLSCILCILLLGLTVYIGVQQYKKSAIADVLTKSTYRFGKYIFDSVNHTLTYEGENISCTPQAAKLLLGFAKSPELFLTNDKIAEICGWALDDLSLSGRRRKAISLLGKLFGADDSVHILSLLERKGYQIVISK